MLTRFYLTKKKKKISDLFFNFRLAGEKKKNSTIKMAVGYIVTKFEVDKTW